MTSEIEKLLARMAIENIPTVINAVRAMANGDSAEAARLSRRAAEAQAAKLAIRRSLKKPRK